MRQAPGAVGHGIPPAGVVRGDTGLEHRSQRTVTHGSSNLGTPVAREAGDSLM